MPGHGYGQGTYIVLRDSDAPNDDDMFLGVTTKTLDQIEVYRHIYPTGAVVEDARGASL